MTDNENFENLTADEVIKTSEEVKEGNHSEKNKGIPEQGGSTPGKIGKTSDNDELADLIAKTTSKAVKKGAVWGKILTILITVLLIGGMLYAGYYLISQKFSQVTDYLEELKMKFETAFEREESADSHDIVIDGSDFWGYVAADFEQAVLSDAKKTNKIIVLEQNVSDTVLLTDTGLLRFKAFTKSQYITYKGVAPYTVDMGKIRKSDFEIDQDSRTVTIHIPHAVCQTKDINIDESDIQFGDISKGLFGFGKIDITPEDFTKLQAEARDKMVVRLEEMNVQETADNLARLVVMDYYKPLLNGIANTVSLNVEFKD